jgi:3-deoxy-D-manno-octulosonic-acid transferase
MRADPVDDKQIAWRQVSGSRGALPYNVPSGMYFLYSALLAATMVLAIPFWLWQMFRHGKYTTGLGERWGRVPQRIRNQGTAPTIWVHAVSVGEVLAVRGLIERWKQQFPEHRVVVSTTTDTGQKLARERFGEADVFYFPLDFALAIRPYLQELRPAMVILAETEFWPNFLRLAHASGARIAVVNARISDRSLPNYRRFRFLLERSLRQIDLFLTQTPEDERRLIEIGAPEERVEVSGNLKFDVPEPAPPPILSELKAALLADDAAPVLVCGSTVEGEEALLVPALRRLFQQTPRATVLLAPRHPERFGAAADLLQQNGIASARRSQWRGETLAGRVLLLDTIGELGALYALADVAFVGGSLVPRGGHNIIEPARYGSAILIGPHTENFRDIVAQFRAQGAVRITDSSRLERDLLDLMSNEEARVALGQRAADVLAAQAGATARTVTALERLLGNNKVKS